MTFQRKSAYKKLLVFTILVLTGLWLFSRTAATSTSTNIAASAIPANPIVLENQKSGSQDWKSPNFDQYIQNLLESERLEHATPSTSSLADQGSGNNAPTAAWTDTQDVKGYASKTSVNVGDQIALHVSSTAAQYQLTIYRMGWYGGSGGSTVVSTVILPGSDFGIPTPDPTTGLIEANWPVAYTLNVPTNWVSGIYMVWLQNVGSSYVSYIPFVVRNDNQTADLLYLVATSTWQAYNNWGGKSLYDYNSTDGRAYKVSYDRPYAQNDGSGHYYSGDYNMIRWLEKSGYNVTYVTSEDLHDNPNLMHNRKVLVSVFHDEYYSMEMFDNVKAIRDSGKSLAYFTSNNIYWQIRYEPSRLAVNNRIIVCYKKQSNNPVVTLDPWANDPDPAKQMRTTVLFRDPPVNKPENQILGVMFENAFGYGDYRVWTVKNANHWIYEGTGLNENDTIDKLMGYEWDRTYDNGYTPPNLTTISETTIVFSGTNNEGTVSDNGVYLHQAVIWQAPSGAWVLNVSVNYWQYFLEGNYIWPLDTRVQRITMNVLNRMISDAAPLPTATPTLTFTPSPSLTPSNTFTPSVTTAPSATSQFTSTNTATATQTLTPTLTTTNMTGPTTSIFYRAINMGGPALVIDGNNWEDNTGITPNFTTLGSVLCNPWQPVTPATDASRASMIQCSRQHWAHNAVMSSVPNGTYEVYVYTWLDWADPNPPAYTFYVQGQFAATYQTIASGRWDRLGPWTANVTAGTLTIQTNGGLANLSGIEVYRVVPSATATNTATAVSTSTFTSTATLTQTNTPTVTLTATPTDTATFTFTPSATETSTPLPTNTPSATGTNTEESAPTFLPNTSDTPLPTATTTNTFTATATNTSSSTSTSTPTASNTATNTPGGCDTEIATIPLSRKTYGVGVNELTNRVYAANGGDNTVTVIDGATNTVIATIPVSGNPIDVSVNAATNRIYVTNSSAANTITVIDGATNTVMTTIPVGSWPSGVDVNASTNRIYVSNSFSGTVSVIDGATNSVIDTLLIGNNPSGVGVNPITNRVYVTNGANIPLSVIDGATDTIIATIPMEWQYGTLAVNIYTNRIYVVSHAEDSVYIIDGATNTVVDVVPVGDNPTDVAVNAYTNRIYTADLADNTVSVVNETTDTVIATVPVVGEPYSIGVNTLTNRIYVGKMDLTLSVIASCAVSSTPVPTATYTPSRTLTQTPSATASATATVTATASRTSTPTRTNTPTATFTATETPTLTFTPSATETGTSSPTNTPTVTETETPSPTATASATLNCPTNFDFAFEDYLTDAVVKFRFANTSTQSVDISAFSLVWYRYIDDDLKLVRVSAGGINASDPSGTELWADPNGDGPLTGPYPQQHITTRTAVTRRTVPAASFVYLYFDFSGTTLSFPEAYELIQPADFNGSTVMLNGDPSCVISARLNPTRFPQATYTFTPSGTPTATTPALVTATPQPSDTATATATETLLPLVTATPLPTNTPENTATSTATITSTATTSRTSTPTRTFTPTVTVTYTPSRTFTRSSTPTPTQSKTPTPSQTFTPTATFTPSATGTAPTATNTATPISICPTVVASIPVGDLPYSVGVNTNTNRIYVANFNSHGVSVIDGTTNTVITTIPITLPVALAVNSVTNRIYVSSLNVNDSVYVIDGATNTIIESIPVGESPSAVAVNPITDRVYVANSQDNTVMVLKGSATGSENRRIATIPVGVMPLGITVNASANLIYVTNYGDSNHGVSVIDGSSNTVVTSTQVSSGLRGVAVNPNTHRVFVANYDNSSISVLTDLGELLTTVPLNGVPFGVDVNTSINLVYVTLYGSGSVAILDGTTYAVRATVPVGVWPEAVSVNAITRRTYVTVAGSDTIAVIDDTCNPTPIPSSTTTPSMTVTKSPTVTASATFTPSMTETNTPLPSNTPTTTATNTQPPLVTATPLPSNTPENTATLTASVTPSETATLTATNTASATVTATVTTTSTNTPTGTSTATSTNTPTATLTATVTSTFTPSQTLTASATSAPTLTFYRAINIGGPALVIDGNNWEANSGTTTNFTTNGSPLCDPWVTLNPPTDAARAQMISCYREHWAFNMAMSNMPSGTYVVYAYVWQEWNNTTQEAYNIGLEGQTVISNYNPGTVGGKWARLGPWTVNLTDGTLNLTTGGAGLADISGLEVYRLTSGGAPSATPQPSATVTVTASRTTTSTNTSTVTRTATAVVTATSSRTPTPSVTSAQTNTATSTTTPTSAATATRTPTATVTPTSPHTNTPSPTATSTSAVSATVTATNTASPTGLPATATLTSTNTLTATVTNTRTNTPSPTATSSSAATFTLTATNTNTPSQTGVPATATATRTFTPVAPPATATLTPSFTRTPTVAPTNTQTRTATPTSVGITGTATATKTSTRTLTPTRTSTTTRTPTITPTPSRTPSGVPTFFRAYNLGGASVVIDGNTWLAGTSSDLAIGGGTTLCNQAVTLVPATDANRATMIRCSITGTAPDISVVNIANGMYDVYVYVWEDDTPSTYSISIQAGQVFVNNHNSGTAGSWQRLGPYTVNITGGWFSLDSFGGQANFSGLEFYSR